MVRRMASCRKDLMPFKSSACLIWLAKRDQPKCMLMTKCSGVKFVRVPARLWLRFNSGYGSSTYLPY
jgi:hypothetical protein